MTLPGALSRRSRKARYDRGAGGGAMSWLVFLVMVAGVGPTWAATQDRQSPADLRWQERSVLGKLDQINRRLVEQRVVLDALTVELEAREQELGLVQEEIARLAGEVEAHRQALAQRAKAIYIERQEARLAVLLMAPSYVSFVRKQGYLDALARREGEVLAQQEATLQALASEEVRLEVLRARLRQRRDDLLVLLETLRKDKAKKHAVLTRLRKERTLYQEATRELEQQSATVGKLIRRQAREAPGAGSRFSMVRGQLPWPVEGTIVGTFGRQLHPKFSITVFRKGIDIRPDSGAVIWAVHDGLVVYAGWFRGYGQLVILDHRESYYSLYAHLGSMKVGVGDRVRGGQALGVAGEGTLTEEDLLHFEIRHRGEPIDPLVWLKQGEQTGKAGIR